MRAFNKSVIRYYGLCRRGAQRVKIIIIQSAIIATEGEKKTRAPIPTGTTRSPEENTCVAGRNKNPFDARRPYRHVYT